MEEESKPEEQKEPEPAPEPAETPRPEYGPAYSRTTWRACCLAPAIAVAALLILTVAAGLFSPRPRLPGIQQPGATDKATLARREAFVRFGREYFTIAAKADNLSEAAFSQTDAFVRRNGSLDEVHAAFLKAGQANAEASKAFENLAVPQELLSQSKVMNSLDATSKSYELRSRACRTMVDWNGDVKDHATAEKYRQQADEINRLTIEGLHKLGEAARDNGLTDEDARKFLPTQESLKASLFDGTAIPWQ